MSKFNAVLIQKTVFFTFDGVPSGFLKLRFRKRRIVTSWIQILRHAHRARRLFKRLPTIALYAELLSQAKDQAYQNRADSERVSADLDSLIRRCVETALPCTIPQAIDLLLNGAGIAESTGRYLDPITCVEKRRKTLANFITLLRARFYK